MQCCMWNCKELAQYVEFTISTQSTYRIRPSHVGLLYPTSYKVIGYSTKAMLPKEMVTVMLALP